MKELKVINVRRALSPKELAKKQRKKKIKDLKRRFKIWCRSLELSNAVWVIALTAGLVGLLIIILPIKKLAEASNRVTILELEVVKSEPISVSNSMVASSQEPVLLESLELEPIQELRAEVQEEALQAVISAYGPGEVYYYNISDEEKILIAKVVWAEARGEALKGQVAVAATVFNRLMSDDPAIDNESIYSVVTQSGAYAPIKDVSYKQALNCLEAVEQAAKGYDPTREVFEEGARFFYAPEGTTDYELARREGVTKLIIGNHIFHDKFAGEN